MQAELKTDSPVIKDYADRHPERSLYIVKGSCILPNEELYEHCRIARASGFTQLLRGQVPPFSTPLIVVGSGLSASKYVDEIMDLSKKYPVMAIKGANDWLISNGVIPTFSVAADPQEKRHDCFKYLNMRTIYLCASQMHPKTWDYLKGRKVVIWHAQIEKDQNKREGWDGIPLVHGGGTTGLRSLALAWVMGFRQLELYGFDSCVKDDGTYKLDGTKTRDDDTMRRVFVGEKEFLSSDGMAAQIMGLVGTLQVLKGIKVNPHGDGYFQEYLRAGKAAGWPV